MVSATASILWLSQGESRKKGDLRGDIRMLRDLDNRDSERRRGCSVRFKSEAGWCWSLIMVVTGL